jgi:L-fuconolactonase
VKRPLKDPGWTNGIENTVLTYSNVAALLVPFVLILPAPNHALCLGTFPPIGRPPRSAECMGASVSVLTDNSLDKVTNEDLNVALASLAPEVKARLAGALAQDQSMLGAQPEKIAKLMENRKIWESNRAKFDTWLKLTPEDALEPELEIVDPHHHVWDMRELRGFNMFGMFKQQYYMTDELIDDFIGGGHNITHSVFVTTHAFFNDEAEPSWMAPLGEVQAMQGVAAQFASGKYSKTLRAVAGIIGTADLLQYGAEVEPLLVACKAASPNYRGIRCNAAHDPAMEKGNNFHPTPGMYSDPKFREGFALLEKHDLVFDAFVFASQLDEFRELAKAFSGTTIVLDHVGSPLAALGNYAGAPSYDGKQAETLEQWKQSLDLIAKECPNVHVKVGGLAIPQLGHGFESRERPPGSEEVASMFKDMCLWTVGTFGANRCMLEGNFPVDKVSMSYTVLWNAYKRMTKDAGLSESDRALLFSGTAKKVYRL